MTKLREVHAIVANKCCEIEDLFKPGAKVTVIVRNPSQDKERHSAALFVSNDQPDDIISAMEYLKRREE